MIRKPGMEGIIFVLTERQRKNRYISTGQGLSLGRKKSVLIQEPVWGHLMWLILLLHATVYASCPQSRESLHRGHCHHHEHYCSGRRDHAWCCIWKGWPSGYELKFNIGPGEVRDFHPPFSPPGNLASSFPRNASSHKSYLQVLTGTTGMSCSGWYWGHGNKCQRTLGFPRHSSVCFLVCLSQKLWTPQNRSEKRTLYVHLLNLAQRAFTANVLLCAQWRAQWHPQPELSPCEFLLEFNTFLFDKGEWDQYNS